MRLNAIGIKTVQQVNELKCYEKKNKSYEFIIKKKKNLVIFDCIKNVSIEVWR